MTKKKTSLWSKILLISLSIIILMSILADVLTLGERLRAQNVYLEYLYYVLIAVIVVGGILYPLFGVFTSPIFSLDKLHYANGDARKRWCKKLVKNLLDNVDLTEEEKVQVKGYLECKDETDDKLIEFFDRKIRPEINAEIYDTAKKVLIITAVSQNSLYDMLGMASANFCLVRRIVEICGFRPTTPQVIRLYIKILSYTLLAGALEDLNIDELLPLAMEGTFSKISGIVLASATQGTINALTTLRIAVLTKNYLLNADVAQTRKELRKKSYTEAYSILKEIVAGKVEKTIKAPVKGLFKKKEEVDYAND